VLAQRVLHLPRVEARRAREREVMATAASGGHVPLRNESNLPPTHACSGLIVLYRK